MIMLPAMRHCSTYSNYIEITPVEAKLSVCLDGTLKFNYTVLMVRRHKINCIMRSQGHIIGGNVCEDREISKFITKFPYINSDWQKYSLLLPPLSSCPAKHKKKQIQAGRSPKMFSKKKQAHTLTL